MPRRDLSGATDLARAAKGSLGIGLAVSGIVAMVVLTTLAVRASDRSEHQASISASPSAASKSAGEAVHNACKSLVQTSKGAIEKVNAFVAAFNAHHNTDPAQGPAVDSLNNSASTAESGITDGMPPPMRDAFNGYVDAARSLAIAIGTHASTDEFNKRVNQLNDTKGKALTLCRGPF